DDDPLEQVRAAENDDDVPVGQRVERAWEDRESPLWRASHSTLQLRLVITDLWLQITNHASHKTSGCCPPTAHRARGAARSTPLALAGSHVRARSGRRRRDDAPRYPARR